MDQGNGVKKPLMQEPQKKQDSGNGFKKVTSLIMNVKKKDGETKGKKWTLYTIFGLVDGNETSFTTFDQKWADMAFKEKESGMQFVFEYEVTEKGNNPRSLTPWEPSLFLRSIS